MSSATSRFLCLIRLFAAVSLSALPALPSLAAAPPSPILVSYDFEEDPPSGPDTFRLFEQPRGRVDLSEAFRVSGLRSLRLREGEGDSSFSEFQGYFPERTQGPLLVQFYILFADPRETFNFGLAGPRWFLLKLADVYHLRGWVDEERSARERIYGRLHLGN